MSFTVNPDFNYYTIRQNARNKYYEKMKEDGWRYKDIKNMMTNEMCGACGWSEARDIANLLNTEETVQDFYDKLKETDYDGIVPPKKWLKMTVSDFVPFVLHELHFYWLSAKKKEFFSILLNHYFKQ